MTDALRRSSNAVYCLLALSLVAGVVLRLVHLDSQSVWSDEAFSWDRSTKPFPEMMGALIADFIHPPLHYLFLRGWLDVVGNSSAAARLLVALFGIASLPAIYWLGRELYDRSTATIAVVLLAISQLAIAYSQEIRPYSQLMFFTLMTTASYLRAVERRGLAALLGATLCAVVALGTHYYAVFVIAGLGIWHVLHARERLPLRWIALALVLGIAACVPWGLSGVVEAALNSPKTVRVDQPPYFSVGWDTPLENLVAFGNARVESVVARGNTPWAIIVSSALFCAPVLLMLRPDREPGFLAMGLVVTLGALGGFWKWVLLSIVLMAACRWVESFDDRRRLATIAFLLVVLLAAVAAQFRYVPYFFVFLLGLLAATPLRRWLPQLGTPQNDPKRASFLALLVAIPLVALLLAGTQGVQYDVRYALAALAPFYVLVARAVTLITKPALRYAWITAIIAFSIAGIHTVLEVPYKENYRDALAFLHDSYKSGDCVAFVPRWAAPAQWHLYGYEDVKLHSLRENELNVEDAGCRDTWLVAYERVISSAARGRVVETALAEHRSILDERQYHWVRVVHFGPRK